MPLSKAKAAEHERKALNASRSAGCSVGEMGIIHAVLAVAYMLEKDPERPLRGPGGSRVPAPPRPALPTLPPMTAAPPPPIPAVHIEPGSAPRSTSDPVYRP